MKRVLGTIIFFVVLYAIYTDLTAGTLSNFIPETQIEEINEGIIETSASIQYVEVSIKPGDTLLALIESTSGFPQNMTIEEMITDFQALNDGTKPEEIKIGKTYKIPVYKNDSAE